jgi:hypothetical protein
MCLQISSELTNKFRQENSGEITVYKQVKLHLFTSTGQLRCVAPYKKNVIYSGGELIAKKRWWRHILFWHKHYTGDFIAGKWRSKVHETIEDGGIHVYIDENSGDTHTGDSTPRERLYTLKCVAHMDDLIAVGHTNWWASGRNGDQMYGKQVCAAFKKIYIPHAEINRLLEK